MAGLKRGKSEASADLSSKDISLQNELIEDLFREYFRESDIGSVNNNLKTLLLKILESTEGNIALCSIPGFKILYITPSMAELLGIKTKNQLKAPIDKYLRIKSKTEFENSLNQLKPDGSAIMMELRIGIGEKETASFSFRKAVLGEKIILFVTNPRLKENESKIAEIQRSEEHYRTLVENIYGVFYSLDSNGVIHYISPAIEKLSDYKPNELVGKSFPQFIHSEDLPGLMENFKSDLSGKLGSYDYRVTKKRGGYFWVRSYSQVIGSPENPPGLSGILIDITERKIFEEELQESRKNLQTFFNTINDFVFVLDEKANILQTNKVVHERLGYSEDEVKGKKIIELHPEDKRAEAAAVVKEMLSGSKDLYTLPLVTKNGESIPVETFITHGEWGGRKVLFGVSRDVTKRKKAEEKLREKTEELDKFFSSALDLLCIADTDGYFRRLNAEWQNTLGYALHELEGRRFMDFVHPDDVDATLKAVKQLTLQKEVLNFINRYRCKDGSYKWIEWRSFPAGKIIYTAARDITEKKRAQEALEESERKYRLIVDNSLAGIYVTQKHILKYCNQQFVEMFGYKSPAEIIGKHVKEFVSPESWETVDKNVQMRERGEARVSRYEFGAINKDGVKFDVEVFGGRIIYEGKPAIQGMIIDITERKRAEESLYAQIERIQRQQTAIVQLATSPNVISGDIDSALQVATEIAADALDCERVSVWMFNEKGTEIRCIDLFERSLNKYSSGATLSVNDHPEYFASLQTGRVLETTDSRNDPRTRSFTDSYLIPYGIFSMLEVPIRREGKVVGIVCHEHVGGMRNWHPDEVIFAGEVADQVSQLFLNAERNKAIEAMHDSEEQFSTFMDHVPAIVFLKDQEGKALYINKSFQDNFGDDWIGKTVFDKLPKEIAGAMDADDKLALTAGVTEKVETISTLKGKNHIFQTVKFPIHRSEKSPLLGGLAIDITDRMKAEEALKLNSERMQSLLRINQMTDAPVKEIADFAMDEGVRLTKSKFGFLAYMNEDETKINMFSWSKAVLTKCKLPYESLIIPVTTSGLLSQVIKQRKPVITNDYDAPNPWKSCYPDGHIPLRRIINIPVFSGAKIALIAGVANKDEEYNEEDASQLTLLIEGMWNLIERKRSEEIIQNREATINSIFRAAPVGIGMVINRVFQEVNDTLCSMVSYSKEELVGQSARILYPSEEEFNYVGTEKYRQMSELGTGTVETRWRRKDGTIFDIILRSTLIDPADQNKGVTFTALDITERKRAEEALRINENRLRQIIDLVPHFIFAKDSEGHYILVNKAVADAYGTTVNDLTGRTDADFAKSEQEALQFRKDDMEVIEGGKQKVVPEEQITDSTGERRLLHTTKIPFTLSDSISPGVLGVSVDITERKMIEEEREKLIKELEAKNAELESFNYTVSHDLKSPLITIKGFIGMLEYDLASGNKEKLDSNLQRIKEAADKMANLLEDLLELSKIGQVASPRVEIPLRVVISEALALLAGSIEKNKIQIIIQPDLPIVHGIQRQLVEVLQNLVENAIKFMGEQPKPRVEIGMRKVEDEIIFFVKDNGIGIDPRYHDIVFGLFSKLDARSEGTGIGLALVKRIIEVHGGKIWIESKGLKKGSTFCFTIPVKKRSS
jgi:PAS domain S-box-containing protein